MVLYRCKDSYAITVNNGNKGFLYNFNYFPADFAGDRRGEVYMGTISFTFKPYEIPLNVPYSTLFYVKGFNDPQLDYPLDIHLCFANNNGMQSVKLIPRQGVSFEVIEDNDTCNIIRHTYDSQSYFEILLGSTEQKLDTETILLYITTIYTK